MVIQRINAYDDPRFSRRILSQHGCFLVDGDPYEIEIISEFEAIVRGKNAGSFPELIDHFRFFTPQIACFYDESLNIIREYSKPEIMKLPLDMIQPSQFFADSTKINAVSTFIHTPNDIIIPVLSHAGRFIALDGHTRLYYAVMQGWNHVRAVADTADNWIYRFVSEAQNRGIYQPSDLIVLSHEEYQEKWLGYCNRLFAEDSKNAFEHKEDTI